MFIQLINYDYFQNFAKVCNLKKKPRTKTYVVSLKALKYRRLASERNISIVMNPFGKDFCHSRTDYSRNIYVSVKIIFYIFLTVY